ncbi:MAG TPA: 4-alpha-glucanotransferase, partial [Ancylobacter sp.]
DGSERSVAIRPTEGRREERTRPDGRLGLVRLVDLPELPLGRHRIVLGDTTCRLTVAPSACYVPTDLANDGRRFGLATHLYTLRRASLDQGIGDFSALGSLGAAAAGLGASTLGLNPLHALFDTDRERASPYHPSDRRFLDPVYIDVAALGGDVAGFADLSRAVNVDYTGVWAAKESALRAAFAGFGGAPDFESFLTEGGEPLKRFAAYQAIAKVHPRTDWRQWPAALRDAASADVASFTHEHVSEVRFALWQQWIADRQLGAAASQSREAGLSLGFYRDLAVGTAPDGAEAWAEAGMLMQGVNVGAPPDPLGPEGQNWNLPPPDPLALQRDGYESFARLVAANMRHAGALRIDHVMGLRRLFLLPAGAGAVDGAYLAYPFEDLAGQVAAESMRAQCMVVGEDLGTVPFGMREQLAAERMLSYRVLWFERSGEDFMPPEDYPSLAAACVSTHDLPTLTGWWDGVDIGERRALGLMGEDGLIAALAEREAEKVRLGEALLREGLIDTFPEPGAAMSDAFFVAVHAFVGRTCSMLALAQLDDLAGEAVAVNLPGTDRERPNWRRRLGRPVDEVMGEPRVRAALAALGKGRLGAKR